MRHERGELSMVTCPPIPATADPEEYHSDQFSGAESSDGLRPKPPRDRVLVAMQRFFNGRPTPEREPLARAEDYEAAETPEGQADTVAAARGVADEAPTVFAAAHSLSGAAELPTVRLDGGVATELFQGSAISSLDASTGEAAAVSAHAEPGNSEALRRCLDELRWHGEALRRCAAGEDATGLCAEATRRRRELLWSLSLPQAASAAT